MVQLAALVVLVDLFAVALEYGPRDVALEVVVHVEVVLSLLRDDRRSILGDNRRHGC